MSEKQLNLIHTTLMGDSLKKNHDLHVIQKYSPSSENHLIKGFSTTEIPTSNAVKVNPAGNTNEVSSEFG